MPEEMNKLGLIIVLFIGIVLGTAFLTQISNQTSSITSIFTVSNETLTTAVATHSTPITVNDNLVVVSFIHNMTNSEPLTGVCNVTLSTGQLACNATGGANAYIGYLYKPNDYVDNSTSRILIRLLVVFFAIGILSVAIIGLYKMGMFNQFK